MPASRVHWQGFRAGSVPAVETSSVQQKTWNESRPEGRLRAMSGGCRSKRVVERTLVDRTEQSGCRPISLDDHEGWLRRHPEVGEHGARIVTELREGELVLVDERLERGIVTRPGDPDEVDSSFPPLRCSLDRGCFCVADRSSRGPEPERDRSAGHGGTAELAAADERRGEVQDGGNPFGATGSSARIRARARAAPGNGQQPEESERGSRATQRTHASIFTSSSGSTKTCGGVSRLFRSGRPAPAGHP
jgi:hypothetical protein